MRSSWRKATAETKQRRSEIWARRSPTGAFLGGEKEKGSTIHGGDDRMEIPGLSSHYKARGPTYSSPSRLVYLHRQAEAELHLHFHDTFSVALGFLACRFYYPQDWKGYAIQSRGAFAFWSFGHCVVLVWTWTRHGRTGLCYGLGRGMMLDEGRGNARWMDDYDEGTFRPMVSWSCRALFMSRGSWLKYKQ
jgi:hypothetical protein